jgi:hypothetical protein
MRLEDNIAHFAGENTSWEPGRTSGVFSTLPHEGHSAVEKGSLQYELKEVFSTY